jgi:hypothetical protein
LNDTDDVRKNVKLESNVSNYRFERHRLISFAAANWTAPVDPVDLAAAGFYWVGVDDVCRCPFCRLEVRGWEPLDTGMGEHLRWNFECPLLRGLWTGNTPIGKEGAELKIMRAADSAGRSYLSKMNIVLLNDEEKSNAELGIVSNTIPMFPRMSTKPSRLLSFREWPASITQRPVQLSDAGFFYTDIGDRVVCFHCGGGLKDWRPYDDPWVEHAKWFRECIYLNIKKGKEFIKNVNSLVSESNVQAETAVLSVPQQAEASVPQQAQDAYKCKICLTANLEMVFLPCGHITACLDCSQQLVQCPMCRGQIDAYVKVYMS